LPSTLKNFCDDLLAEELLVRVENGLFPQEQVARYLDVLLQCAPIRTREKIRKWFVIIEHAVVTNQDFLRSVGFALLQSEEIEDVELAVDLMLQFPEVGKSLINIHNLWRDTVWTRIEELKLANLYLWVRNEHPPEDDPPDESRPGRMTRVTPELAVARFRDSLLRHLANRGTDEAIIQIQRISEVLAINLDEYMNDARETMLNKTWQPIDPSQLKALLQSNQIRWIRTESQLLGVIVDKLEQLQSELQGKERATSSSIDLWNESRKTIDNNGCNRRTTLRTPKDENRLSDYIERFLTRELKQKKVLVDREVQVERGNFTDILIETFPEGLERDSSASIAVIIEVKGDWHTDVYKAMREQLTDRYLAPKGMHHGVYLVGKFFCSQWDNEDDLSRWEASQRHNSRDLVGVLSSQAEDLSRQHFNIALIVLDCTLPES
ncbi:MAG: hypothetical protein M9941_20150, partial [Anaerolineae bacterium]|nr:hypothetical protein [Anaerolineae bacterium]